MRFARELEVASQLARQAGALIMRVYQTPFSVTEKPGGAGPVTLADQHANELIVSGLKEAFAADEVIAEESPFSPPRSKRVWFVDPLDGTREFVERNGMFAVHIGLAIDGQPVAGVVYSPAQEALWSGAKETPCQLELSDQRHQVCMAQPPKHSSELRLLVSRSHRSKRTESICRALGITQVREHGSVGLKCALLAMGEADLYLHPSSQSSRWDSCAPQAVLEAAGGILVDFRGQRYAYDGSEIRNRTGLVACAPKVWERFGSEITRIAQETGLLTS